MRKIIKMSVHNLTGCRNQTEINVHVILEVSIALFSSKLPIS